MQSKNENSLYKNKYLIVEDGKQQYPNEKMQSARIKQIISKNSEIKESTKGIIKNSSAKTTVYVIGSTIFYENVQKYLIQNKTSSKFTVKKVGNTDEAMQAMGASFPAEATSIQKESSTERRLVLVGYEDFDKSMFSKSDISAFLMALDELSTMQIFPNTEEVMYDTMIKVTDMYMFDKSKTKPIVDYYIKKIAEKSKK